MQNTNTILTLGSHEVHSNLNLPIKTYISQPILLVRTHNAQHLMYTT